MAFFYVVDINGNPVGCINGNGDDVPIGLCHQYVGGRPTGMHINSQSGGSRTLKNNRKLSKGQLNYLNTSAGSCGGGCGCGGSCGGNNLNSPGRFRKYSPNMAKFGYGNRSLSR